jgi:hypothetical protein
VVYGQAVIILVHPAADVPGVEGRCSNDGADRPRALLTFVPAMIAIAVTGWQVPNWLVRG